MSLTRRRDKYCSCVLAPDIGDCRERYCHRGNCLEWVCPWCGGIYASTGPLSCECSSPPPRPFFHHDMLVKPPLAVKENKPVKKRWQ